MQQAALGNSRVARQVGQTPQTPWRDRARPDIKQLGGRSGLDNTKPTQSFRPAKEELSDSEVSGILGEVAADDGVDVLGSSDLEALDSKPELAGDKYDRNIFQTQEYIADMNPDGDVYEQLEANASTVFNGKLTEDGAANLTSDLRDMGVVEAAQGMLDPDVQGLLQREASRIADEHGRDTVTAQDSTEAMQLIVRSRDQVGDLVQEFGDSTESPDKALAELTSTSSAELIDGLARQYNNSPKNVDEPSRAAEAA